MKETATTEVSFVTRKCLVTFSHPIALMIDERVIFAPCAICEYQESSSRSYERIPTELTLIGLDDRKLTKSYQITVGMGCISVIVQL